MNGHGSEMFFNNRSNQKSWIVVKMLMFSSFSEFGTMLEIRDIHVFRDGRSVIDTRGRRRFRVLERRIRDGYNVASVEFLKDVPIPQEQLKGTI